MGVRTRRFAAVLALRVAQAAFEHQEGPESDPLHFPEKLKETAPKVTPRGPSTVKSSDNVPTSSSIGLEDCAT